MKLNIKLLLGTFLCLSVNALAQNAAPTPMLYTDKTLNELQIIQQKALESEYAYEQTRYLSYNIGARLTGSPQAQRAIEYVSGEMRKLGLEVKLQKLTVPHWVRGEEKGELIEWNGMAKETTQRVVLTALGRSVATPPEGITAEVVVVNDFDELETLGREKVEGKIVLFNYKFDQKMAEIGFGDEAYSLAGAYRRTGAIEAAKLGASAALVRSIGASQNRLAHTGSMNYDDDVPKIPAAAVSFEDAEMIAYLASVGKVKMKLILTPQTLPDTTSYNVIADLKGSERPDEFVIVSGHLDSWDLGHGAIDDATGVAMAMQVPYLL